MTIHCNAIIIERKKKKEKLNNINFPASFPYRISSETNRIFSCAHKFIPIPSDSVPNYMYEAQ